MLAIHPPAEAPSLVNRIDICSSPTRFINLRHPAYPPGEDVLLRLAALDHAGGGLHHGVALDALTIVAANAPGGYLSKTRDGRPIEVARHAILTDEDYFFIV